MNKRILKFLLFVILIAGISAESFAQRTRSRRGGTTRRTPTQTQATVQAPLPDSTPAVVVAPPPPPPPNDSLPYRRVKRSLRRDETVDNDNLAENPILTYEHLRGEDGVYRHKIWREIDIREKINTPFRYAVDEDDGNGRFISLIMRAIDDSTITVFSNVDDRFTTPMTKAEVAKAIAGDTIEVPMYNENGEMTGTKKMLNEINLDSFYKFRIKEEVIFDKESSRLFWRILGIAPLKNVYTSSGVFLGESELFWIYYPDIRQFLANRQAYNGKNYGARFSWEQLFESRMFYGRIVKTTMDNPYDLYLRNYKVLQESGILQLLEGDNIKETIFNYEQDLWSY